MKDIEQIIARVREAMPAVRIVQMQKTHSADDDGLWWFRLPGIKKDIQIESSTYDCPFLIEHDDMNSSEEKIRTESVEVTVGVITDHLKRINDNRTQPNH